MTFVNFGDEYKKSLICITEELKSFDEYIKEQFCINNTKIEIILDEYVNRSGKRIRPSLIFLLTKSLGNEVNQTQFRLAFAVEMIHNATLIHDDIIDGSLLRRGGKTLNEEYDSKLAVLAGDYLLSLALKALVSFENQEIIKIHTDSISNLIEGEIEQYFEKSNPVSIQSYIEKSKKKTAELFKAALCSTNVLGGKAEYAQKTENFALDFGTAFQIHNDLKDVEQDLKNATFTAPALFYIEEKKPDSVHNMKINDIKQTCAIDKTRDLIKLYADRAIENINFIEDNQYKQAIINLCKIHTMI